MAAELLTLRVHRVTLSDLFQLGIFFSCTLIMIVSHGRPGERDSRVRPRYGGWG